MVLTESSLINQKILLIKIPEINNKSNICSKRVIVIKSNDMSQRLLLMILRKNQQGINMKVNLMKRRANVIKNVINTKMTRLALILSQLQWTRQTKNKKNKNLEININIGEDTVSTNVTMKQKESKSSTINKILTSNLTMRRILKLVPHRLFTER